MHDAIERTTADLGGLDIVFANAGINGVWAPLEELQPDEWDNTLDINLKALGEDNPQTATSYHNLATNLRSQGRYAEALPYLRKALEEGFKEKKKIQEEADFASLRDLPEFKELMALEPRVL